MERRMSMSLAAAAAISILLQLQVALITPSSCSSVERDDHRCGLKLDGTWATCDPGRCCSIYNYCGDDDGYCSSDTCWFQCPVPAAGYHHQTYHNYQVAGTGGGVLITRLVNATLNNRYLNLNLNIGGDGDHQNLLKEAADNASSSSSPSSSSLLSCARSLSRLPLASRYQYPFAALRAPHSQNNITATRCGRCLKVTNFGVGKLHSQVKVRIVHEPSDKGLELDINTFKQLDIDGSGITKGYFLVKYFQENMVSATINYGCPN